MDIKTVNFCSVKHVDGVSFYLDEELLLDVENSSINNGPGMVEYKLELNDLINQMNDGLTKFGYKIIKE